MEAQVRRKMEACFCYMKKSVCLPVKFSHAESKAISICAKQRSMSRHAWMQDAIRKATLSSCQANRAAVKICNLFGMSYPAVGFLGSEHWSDVEEIIQRAIDNSQ